MAATSSGGSASAAAGYSSASVLSALFVSLRPGQWVKNLVLPLPFLFGSALSHASGWILAAEGFVIFCVISSGIYLINDVKDRERDRAHPVKRNRPLATGLLGVKTAVAAAVVLLAVGLLSAFLLDTGFWQLCALYAGSDGPLLALAEARSLSGGADRGGGASAEGPRGRGPGPRPAPRLF